MGVSYSYMSMRFLVLCGFLAVFMGKADSDV